MKVACLHRLAALLGAGVALTVTATPEPPSHPWSEIESKFLTPPNEFRIIQYSAHEGKSLPIEKMQEAGIGGVKLFMQKKGYLQTEEAWTTTLASIHRVKAAGLQLWMADDNGYPSGMAGGLVVAANPEFETRCLTAIVREGVGRAAIRIDRPDRVEQFVAAILYPVREGRIVLKEGHAVAFSPDHVKFDGVDDPWVLYVFARSVNHTGTQASQTASGFDTTGRYPNLLNPVAMEKFVDLTHAEYARRLGPLKGLIDVFYSNEPNLMSLWFEFEPGSQRPDSVTFVPWDDRLPARFRDQHGYELIPRLAALFTDDSADAKLTRRHFYQTVGLILAENFSGRIADWADRQGIRSAGHPLLEEDMLHHVIGYGNFFDFLGKMQIPACDIGMPGRDEYSNYWMPKYLSSIAELNGRETVVALLDPLINRLNGNLEPRPEEMHRIVNLAYLCGVNQITTYIAWDKYDPAVYRHFSEYVGRLSVLLRGARSAATVGVYYPIETFQAGFVPSAGTWDKTLWPENWRQLEAKMEAQNDTVRSLLVHGIDFNWLDHGALQKASVENGTLMVGTHRYATIVMPQVELLPLSAADKLREFEKAGGRIIWVDQLPSLGDADSEHRVISKRFANYAITTPSQLAPALASAIREDFKLQLKSETPNVFIARFVRENRRLNYLVNDSPAEQQIPITTTDGVARTFKTYDPRTGGTADFRVPGIITIQASSALVVVENPE